MTSRPPKAATRVHRLPTIAPDVLTPAQRVGRSCVSCRKQWPLPRVRIGRLPDGSPVMACSDCAEVLGVD
ncbi:hypothetical protein [Nonomuraea soli]|uniref:Uncharacterized protein n=1 Tax=Nonomuraea soli TaxID=1032476 RepID=A0A7W0HMD6_9ACTN|nr:hypothetical protein [Nonomuraea soli]MBA2888684.1 hypothetical protein [Nonomuraea soli]